MPLLQIASAPPQTFPDEFAEIQESSTAPWPASHSHHSPPPPPSIHRFVSPGRSPPAPALPPPPPSAQSPPAATPLPLPAFWPSIFPLRQIRKYSSHLLPRERPAAAAQA